jgi:hypothetical protein
LRLRYIDFLRKYLFLNFINCCKQVD